MPKTNYHAFRQKYNGLPAELASDIVIISTTDNSLNGNYKGIWDTGATMTTIDEKVFKTLKLSPVNTTTLYGVNSKETVPVVLINLVLPNGIRVDNVFASVSDLNDDDILIGMDIISMGDFSISNFERETVFTFVCPPFSNRTDLYEKALAVNRRK